eukprot:2039194-Rhodomonas_salina.2
MPPPSGLSTDDDSDVEVVSGPVLRKGDRVAAEREKKKRRVCVEAKREQEVLAKTQERDDPKGKKPVCSVKKAGARVKKKGWTTNKGTKQRTTVLSLLLDLSPVYLHDCFLQLPSQVK